MKVSKKNETAKKVNLNDNKDNRLKQYKYLINFYIVYKNDIFKR